MWKQVTTRQSLLVFLLILLAVPVVAIDEPADGPEPTEPREVFFDRVDVDVVNVEVWVADRQGRPVHGLTRDDFEIRENRRPVEITNFLEVREGSGVETAPSEPASPDAVGAEARAPERETVELSRPAGQREKPLFLVVYIDNFNVAPANRRWAMEAVERFLVTRLRPGDRVMLATYDRDLNIREAFTEDRFAVTGAIAEALRLVANQSSLDRERQQILEEIATSRSASNAIQAAERHASYVEFELRRALDALREVVTSLAGLDGRKAFLYVADGLPETPAEDLFVAVDQRFQGSGAQIRSRRFDLQSRYQELIRLANASEVAFYTLDAKGQATDAYASAEYSGVLQHVPGMNVNMIEMTRQQNIAAPMMALAAQTGGRAILRTNALDDALAGVGQDFTDYYSLGFRRAPGGGERYQTLDVRVKRRGLTVRHRKGYVRKDAETRLREGVEAALQHGVGANPLGIQLVFQRPAAATDGQSPLSLEIRIPLGQVVMIPRGEELVGRVEVAVAVLDEAGRKTPVLAQPPVDLQVPAADWPEAQTKYFTYTLGLQVREGRQRITVAVRDALSNQTSYVSEPVSI